MPKSTKTSLRFDAVVFRCSAACRRTWRARYGNRGRRAPISSTPEACEPLYVAHCSSVVLTVLHCSSLTLPVTKVVLFSPGSWNDMESLHVYECIQDVKCSNFVLIMQPCHALIIDNLYLVILTVGRATDPSVGIPKRGRSTGRGLGTVKDIPGHTCKRDRPGLDARSFSNRCAFRSFSTVYSSMNLAMIYP